MEIVVTGAGGFSGSHIVRALLARGHHVTALTGRTRGRLDPAPNALSSLVVTSGDLARGLDLPARIDAVVHAAARSPAEGVTDTDMVHDNVLGTLRLIGAARKAGTKTFIYLSSLSVHGRIQTPVVDESSPIVDPDAYGVTKYLGEVMLRDTEMRSVSIRLPGVLGPQSVRNWLTGVLAAAQAGKTIAIYNPDAAFNNAIHVADLCQFIGDLLEKPDWQGHEAVTVGAAGTTTVRGAVELVTQTIGSSSAITVRPAASSGFTISSAKAQRFGYRPMNIEELLVRFAKENIG